MQCPDVEMLSSACQITSGDRFISLRENNEEKMGSCQEVDQKFDTKIELFKMNKKHDEQLRKFN